MRRASPKRRSIRRASPKRKSARRSARRASPKRKSARRSARRASPKRKSARRSARRASPKRKSARRSARRASPKRKSARRSVRRASPKRKSTRRTSIKRKSTVRSNPKNKKSRKHNQSGGVSFTRNMLYRRFPNKDVVDLLLVQRHKGDGVWLIRHDEHDLFAYKDFYPLLNVNNTLIALMNSQMTDDMVIEILRMMIKYNTVIPIRSLNYAINNYRENVVKWYIKNFPNDITSSFINIAFFIMATRNGNINIVELLHEHLSISGNVEYVTNGYSDAINNRNLRLLEWLHNHGYTPSTNPISEAVVKGYLDIIVWLYERGYNYTADGGFLAVMRNNYNDVLEWLINHNDNDRINLNTSMSFDAAAYAGDLELLRYLYDTSPDPRGVSGDGFMDAVSRGHLNVLRYLFEEREIDMDSEYLHSLEQIASNRKQQNILDYLHRISIYTNGRLPIRNFSYLT